MQCPGCGYEADDASVFCPQCRYAFRAHEDDAFPAGDTVIDLPERGIIADDTIFEDAPVETPYKRFSSKELRQMDVQLVQTAVLVVLIIALFTYTVIGAIPFIPVTIGDLSFGVTGILCLASGLAAGTIFFVLSRRSLRKFRYR